jgi:hypothetical protein
VARSLLFDAGEHSGKVGDRRGEGVELTRFPKAPARLDAELVRTSGQHYAEIQPFTVSGRPLLVRRVQAVRRQESRERGDRGGTRAGRRRRRDR